MIEREFKKMPKFCIQFIGTVLNPFCLSVSVRTSIHVSFNIYFHLGMKTVRQIICRYCRQFSKLRHTAVLRVDVEFDNMVHMAIILT